MFKILSEKIPGAMKHGFWGRKYGKSAGFYASLNCSRFVGDNDSIVEQNLGIVKEELQSKKLITLQQIHSNICIVADLQTESNMKADAIVTKTNGVTIGILTADCAPILFVDRERRIAGAAHAGWRGVASGIIEATIRKMAELDANPENIIAAVGPCIQKGSYEVDDGFKRNIIDGDDCFYDVNHKIYFDLPKYCQHHLIKSGLKEDNIDVIAIDTYADQENYFSYRFATTNTNGICGRNISVIRL